MTELNVRIVLLLSLAMMGSPSFAATDESALLQRLQQAEQQADSPALRQWLQGLVNYQEVARKPHPERASISLPRHAIAARANALLRRWDEQTAFEQLQAQPQRQLKSLDNSIARAARKRWIAQASTAQLRSFQQSSLLQDMPEDVLIALALALPDYQQDQELATRGQSPSTLNYLRKRLLHSSLSFAQQSDLIERLRHNPALHGALPAVQAAWLQQHPAQKQRFLDNWQQDWSADALATALRLQPPNLTQQLQTALNDHDKAPLAAWALWQQGSPQARQALADYAESTDAIAHLAQEIHAWLQ